MADNPSTTTAVAPAPTLSSPLASPITPTIRIHDADAKSASPSSTLSPASPSRGLSSRKRNAHFFSALSRHKSYEIGDDSDPNANARRALSNPESDRPYTASAAPFSGIAMDIPTGSLDDLSSDRMGFSKRGTMLIGGKKVNQLNQMIKDAEESSRIRDAYMNGNGNGAMRDSGVGEEMARSGKENEDAVLKTSKSLGLLEPSPSLSSSSQRRSRSSNSLRVKASAYAAKTLSADDDLLSQKVRSMYDHGVETLAESEAEYDQSSGTDTPAQSSTSLSTITQQSIDQRRNSWLKREEMERAGGLEDWADIDGAQIDRYGFIIPKAEKGEPSSPPQHLQRVSTSLKMATEAPRRKHTIRRAPSLARSARSVTEPNGRNTPSRFSFYASSERPKSSQSAYIPPSPSHSRLRAAANRLPHNRDRRIVDEASDMFTTSYTPPQSAQATIRQKKKEWEREDKWQKMAKPLPLGSQGLVGGGMAFTFDTTSPKVFERTWKGIPDRWRATAWHAFLSASAAKDPTAPSDATLISIFHETQLESSPDDVQIDIDVPRTISSHIMFRRRYRGGQRLLFRVLHAMSLYFPDTGYVQGMATLAATLLSYYAEDQAFIMLVRLWRYRGLERLYQHGFAGLMEALDEFEKKWLAGGEVGEKLNEVGVLPTSYGTKWYLTLFNYSVPFAVQLRIWDVFMLCGDEGGYIVGTGGLGGTHIRTNGAVSISIPPQTNQVPSSPSPSHHRTMDSEEQEHEAEQHQHTHPPPPPFGHTLSILHATSAAIIDGTREIVLTSDFENAMKVLTSWIPVRDEDLFMRVVRAEWRVNK